MSPLTPPHLNNTTPIAPRRIAKRDRLLIAFSALALVVACVYIGWSWKAWTQPGMRYYEQGMDYAAAKHYDLAEQAWITGTQKDPRAWQCYAQLGALYDQAKHPAQAAYAYDAATKIVPDSGDLFLSLERAQTAAGNLDAAYAAAKRATALLPNSAAAAGDYGLLASGKHRDMDAIASLHHALSLDPGSAKYLIALVALEISNLDLTRAESDLAPYLKAHPEDYQGHYYMAVILNQKPRTPDNVRRGIEQAELALPHMIHDPHGYNLIGLLFLAAGRTEAAYRAFLEGYKIDPHSQAMLHGLLDCDIRRGDTKEAALIGTRLEMEATRANQIDHLKHVLGYNHKDTASMLELARLYEQTGRRQEAFGLFVQSLHETPNDARIRPAFSAFLLRSKQPAMAKQILRPDFMP